jgi:hypothetical protein
VGLQEIRVIGTGVAGTPATGVVTVQGITNGTAVNVTSIAGASYITGTTWNSSTTLNTLQYPSGTSTAGSPLGAPAVMITFVGSGTITAGAVSFLTSITSGALVAAQQLYPQTLQPVSTGEYAVNYTFPSGSSSQSFLLLPWGAEQIYIQLSTAIIGGGTITPYWTLLPYTPIQVVSNSQSISVGDVLPTYYGNQQVQTVVDLSGRLFTRDGANISGTSPTSAPSFTLITGGVFGGLPSMSSGQAAPLQLDGNARLIIAGETAISSNVGTAAGYALDIAGLYSITQPAPTNGEQVSLQTDQSGNLLEFPGIQTKAGSAWSSGTGGGTVQYPTGTTSIGAPIGAPAIVVQLDQTSTLTGGAVTFQGSYDSTNWVTIPTAQLLNPQTFASLTNPYSFVANTNTPFLILMQGFQQVRLDLSTTISGTGTVTPYWAVLSDNPYSTSALLGTVGVTQSTTPWVVQEEATTATGESPTFATVGTSSGTALSSNSSRKGLTLVNTSTATISIAFGANPAVLYSGITLYPNGSFSMGTYDFTTAAVNAIASASSSNLAIQEWE